jgi:uncharacterized phage protein gp47/JayE
VTNVKKAYCFPVAWGTGTVDVVIFADPVATGSEIPSSHTKNGVNTSVVAFKLVDSAADFTPVQKGDKALNDTLSTEATVLDVEDQYTLLLDLDIFTGTPQNYTIKSLVKQTQEHITDVRPVNARLATVRAPSILTQNVTMSVSGLTATEKTLVQADIEAYMNSLKPGQTLYLSMLTSMAIVRGATNASVSVPAADVVPATYEAIRPGTVSIT